jgi:hypothetical protein
MCKDKCKNNSTVDNEVIRSTSNDDDDIWHGLC